MNVFANYLILSNMVFSDVDIGKRSRCKNDCTCQKLVNKIRHALDMCGWPGEHKSARHVFCTIVRPSFGYTISELGQIRNSLVSLRVIQNSIRNIFLP